MLDGIRCSVGSVIWLPLSAERWFCVKLYRLIIYNGRNGNYRKINGKNLWDPCDLCEIKSKSIISGVIMVIMIISFRTKTNTDYADLADHSKGTQNE